MTHSGDETTCNCCDGSGVLTVADSVRDYDAGRVQASWCHACPAGRTWKEVGLP